MQRSVLLFVCWQVLLETALESPNEVAADLSMLSADERSQLLSGFNRTDTPALAENTLSQLFEAQAAANPQAACLTEGSRKLTYAEVKSLGSFHYIRGQSAQSHAPSICRLVMLAIQITLPSSGHMYKSAQRVSCCRG